MSNVAATVLAFAAAVLVLGSPVLTCTAGAQSVPGTASERVDPELARRVASLIGRLEAADFEAREAATAAIEVLPAEALPLIEAALATGDLSPEVSIRLGMKVDVLRRKSTPYDRELRREFDWNRTDTLAVYDRGGHTDPRWDAAAREALTLYVRPRFDPNRSPKDDRRILAAFERAIGLGCDDPFVLYSYANRYRLTPGHDPSRLAGMWNRATAGMIAGHYPAIRRLMVLAHHAASIIEQDGKPTSPGARRDATSDLDQALGLLAEAAAQTPGRQIIFDAGAILYEGYARALVDGPDAALAKVLPALKAATPKSNVAALLEADVRLVLAATLDAGGYGEYVDRFRGAGVAEAAVERHRTAAKAAIDAAIAADPSDPLPLNAMLRYLDDTKAASQDYEPWFAKAMAAYPSNLHACQFKLRYLRRLGNQGEEIAFGRACLADGFWSSRIPFIVIDAHANVAQFDRPEEHFGQPEVWNDVRTCYEGYLTRYPNAVADRSRYAQYACWAEQWTIAKAQFDKLGDDAVPAAFRGKQTMDYFRRKTERLTAQDSRP